MQYEIAYSLGLTFKEVSEMEYTEYVGWISYFNQRPVGWREDMRTFRIMQSFGYKGKDSEVFSSLETMRRNADKQREKMGIGASLRNSVMGAMLSSAKGGATIPLA